jgi:hypothetical protein
MLTKIKNRLIKFIAVDLNGWKSIVAWLMLQVPFLVENPLLATAITQWIADPKDPAKIGNLVLQVLLAIGLIHKGLKEVSN